jgi:hypothetical protein
MENQHMKTVSNLLAASLCLGMSASVYAQAAGTQPAKPVAPMADASKAKVAKPIAAPAETSAMSAKKNVAQHEHSLKTVPPTAATTKADKVDASRTNLQKVDTHHEIKPAAKISKPALKTDPSVDAPKAVK